MKNNEGTSFMFRKELSHRERKIVKVTLGLAVSAITVLATVFALLQSA